MPIELFLPFAERLLNEQMSLLKKKGQWTPDMEVDETLRKEMVGNLATRVRNFVLRELLDTFSEEELTRLESLTDVGDEEAVRVLFADRAPVVAESLQRFRRRYLGSLLGG